MIIKNKHFNIKQIAESGQTFRMNPISEKNTAWLHLTDADRDRADRRRYNRNILQ